MPSSSPLKESMLFEMSNRPPLEPIPEISGPVVGVRQPPINKQLKKKKRKAVQLSRRKNRKD